MFMDWKTQYNLYGSSVQIDLWIQYNPYQNTSWDFAKIEKLIPKFIWKGKGPRIAKTVFTKKNDVGGTTLPNFKKSCRRVRRRTRNT